MVGALAAAPANATFPGEDGRIAFHRYLDAAHTRAAILTVNPDGTEVRRVTRPRRAVVDEDPDWSPDGSRLAFARGPRHADWKIYDVGAHGLGLRRLSPVCRPASRCVGDGVPTYSPDGRHVAFGRFDKNYGCCAIVVTDRRGRNLRVVTKGTKPYAIGQPQFSPDGRRIAYIEVAEPRDRPSAVFVVNVDGTGRRRVTPWSLNAGDGPDWSPDGRRILFRSQHSVPGEQPQLYTVRPDGTGLRRLTRLRKGAILSSASFSPSGRSIVFATTGIGGQADLFVMDAGGGRARPITRTRLWEGGPDWGPR